MSLAMHLHANRNATSLPRRVDSLVAAKGTYFAEVEEELRDIKRVNAQGEEDDLRMGLTRTIGRVEELIAMLKEAYKAQTELQTELTLAKSNLQLALANNEMLEDALKREGGGNVKDIGWRRWSAKEEESRRRSTDSAGSYDTAHNSPVPGISPMPSPVPSASSVTSPAPSSDSRFFKFRFGGGSATNGQLPHSPRMPAASATQSPAVRSPHLTSASLPSLVSARDWDKEIEELTAELKKEREAHKTVVSQKEALEAELESLSQALFEEANKMVSTERRKLAEIEDEVRELQSEREALRNALRLLESQIRAANVEIVGEVDAAASAKGHAHTTSISSARAVKSPPSSRPVTPSSAREEVEDGASSAGTVVVLQGQGRRPPPISILEPESPEVTPTPPPETISPTPPALDSRQSTLQGDESSSSTSSSLKPSPAPSASPSPVIGSPEIGDYVYPLMRTADYLPREVSPWADVLSIGSPKPTEL